MTFIETILENPVAQGLGVIAMFITVIGFLQKSDKKVFKIIMVAKIFWIIHFTILGMYSAVVAGIISIIRIFLSLKYKKNKIVFIMVLFITIASGIISYIKNPSLILTIPLIASCISVYGYFFLERVKLRLFMLIVSVFWFTFDFHVVSLGGMLNETLVQFVLIITMYKMVHNEGKEVFFIDKVIYLIKEKISIPDVGRFIILYDYMKLFKNKAKFHFKNIFLKEIKLFKEKK